jgi:hypothetical protein
MVYKMYDDFDYSHPKQSQELSQDIRPMPDSITYGADSSRQIIDLKYYPEELPKRSRTKRTLGTLGIGKSTEMLKLEALIQKPDDIEFAIRLPIQTFDFPV